MTSTYIYCILQIQISNLKNHTVGLLHSRISQKNTKEQGRAVQNGTHWGKLVYGMVLISRIGDKTGLVGSPLIAGHIPPGPKHTRDTAANTTKALNTQDETTDTIKMQTNSTKTA